MAIVSNADWIAALPPGVLAAVRAGMRPLRFARGQRLYDAGDTPGGVNQVRQGFVKLLGLDESGRQPLIVVYSPGAVFSETAVVNERSHNHSAVALTDCVVDQLPTETFWKLYREHPEIPEALCRKFAMIISGQVQVRKGRVSSTLRQLVAGVFLDLLRHSERDGDARAIVVPLTQAEIGDHLGVSRQSVQKEVTELKATKLLDKREGRWVVLNQTGLQSAA